MGFFVLLLLIIGVIVIISTSSSGHSSGGYHGGYVRDYDDDYEDYEIRAAKGAGNISLMIWHKIITLTMLKLLMLLIWATRKL